MERLKYSPECPPRVVSIGKVEVAIFGSLAVLIVGFFTGLYYHRVDHILRTGWMIAYISILYLASDRVSKPEGVLGALLSPFLNRGILAVTAVFLAVHASLVNVPFTNIDLFNVRMRNVDMISHSLGGLVMWLMITEILMNLKPGLERRALLKYSFGILLFVGIGWEVAEWIGSHFTEGILHETILNKTRDVVMEQLGALFGLWMVSQKGFPFRLPEKPR